MPGGVQAPKRASWLALAILLGLTAALLALQAAPSRWASAAHEYLHLSTPAVQSVYRQSLALSSDYGGVHRYSIPGEFNSTQRGGIVHIYLKALRWPVNNGTFHLRIKGFVAFEATTYPSNWTKYTFHNIPEVATQLRLFLQSPVHGWQRELSITFSDSMCEQRVAFPTFNFTNCTKDEERMRSTWYALGDISADFGSTDDVEVELALNDWPRSVSLKAQLWAAKSAPPAQAYGVGKPALIRALPTPFLAEQTLDTTIMARLLKWSEEYYTPLGLDLTVWYILPSQLATVEAHPIIRALVAARRLTLVLWDEFSFYNRWPYYDEQMVQTHSVLSHWGGNVRVLVFDLDEFLVPATAGDTLPSMLGPGGCLWEHKPQDCFAFQRLDIHPYNLSDASGLAAASDEPGLWNRSGANPLLNYRFSNPIPVAPTTPKMMVMPENLMPINVHWSSVCRGKSTIVGVAEGTLQSACDTRIPCAWVTIKCAYIAHVSHMFRVRGPPKKTLIIKPPGWLWMLRG